MILAQCDELTRDSLQNSTLDLFIVACGYEERAVHVAQMLGTGPTRRVSLAFTEHQDHPVRRKNESILNNLGFDRIECSGEDVVTATSWLSSALPSAENQTIRIGIDISSMTRAWCGGLVRSISALPREHPIDVSFFYSPATFSPPVQRSVPPRVLGPIPGVTSGLQLPDRPISLVVGLGYEDDKALGLVEYLEPRSTWLFYTDPAADPQYVDHVKEANEVLLDKVGEDNVIRYKHTDMLFLVTALDSLLGGLVDHSRVVIAPLGPKPFGLIAFLLALKYEAVDVWRVSSGSASEPHVRAPLGEIFGLNARFVPSSEATDIAGGA
jgi:hypothetical protein